MILEPDQWWDLALAHEAAATDRTADHRRRTAAGEPHPVEDFLWDYYAMRPSRLHTWHPGAGHTLAEPEPGHPARPAFLQRTQWRFHVRTAEGVRVDERGFAQHRSSGLRYIHNVSAAVASRPPFFGCFNWHEWAMVYRGMPRHPAPLRLGPSATDCVVERATLACTHFDAYRFFTDEGKKLNRELSFETTLACEQGGCLHVNMDLLGWCLKLGPAIPGDLLLDCYDLALDIRYLDMAAAPYDLGATVRPLAMEEPTGRAEYVRQQKGFATRAATLRDRLLTITGPLAAHLGEPPGSTAVPFDT